MADLRELKDEVVRLNSMANKRIKRMIQADMITPALKGREKQVGAVEENLNITTPEEYYDAMRFKVDRNATYQDVQKAYWQVKHFLNNETSSFKGAEAVIDKIAKATGTTKLYEKYKNNPAMKSQISKVFFRVANKMQEYVSQMKSKGKAESLNYMEIFAKVAMYFESEQIFDKGQEPSVFDLDNIVNSMIEFYTNNSVDFSKNYDVSDSDFISI